MPTIVVSRTMNATAETVFRSVSDIENLPNTVPAIVGVEFLSDRRSGIGTRFRETRMMGGKEHTTDLEITELVENERVRMVADSHGTIWDTLFTIGPAGDGVELKLAMTATGHKLLARIMNVLFKGLFRKGLEKHIDAVKIYCEEQ